MQVQVSFFASPFQTSVIREEGLTWQQLTELLHTHKVQGHKQSGELFNFCRFNPAKRADANVAEVTALMLDVDKQPLSEVQALVAKLAPFQYLAYSTHSHGLYPDLFSLRIVVALSRPVQGAEWKTFAAGIRAWLGTSLDKCLISQSHAYWLPSRDPERQALTSSQPGAPLDVHQLLADTPPVPASSAPVADVWRPDLVFTLEHLRQLPGDVAARLLRGEKLTPVGTPRHHVRVALVYQFLVTYGPGEPDAQLLHLLVSSADADAGVWVREFQRSSARAKAEAQHLANLAEEQAARAFQEGALKAHETGEQASRATTNALAQAAASMRSGVFTSVEVRELAKKAKDPVIRKVLVDVFKPGGLEPEYLQAAPDAGSWLVKRAGRDPGVVKNAFRGVAPQDQTAIWQGVDLGAAQLRDKDLWRRNLIVGENDRPAASEVNVRTLLLEHQDVRGLLIQDTRFSKVRVGLVPWDRDREPFWSATDAGACALWAGKTLGVSIGVSTVWEALETIKGLLPQHDPVRSYLDALAWDGQLRLSAWLSRFAGASTSQYVQHVARSALISAVARVYEPGCKADQVAILEGGQGALKTSLIRALVPHTDLFATTTSKLSLDNVRLLQKMVSGPWIIELGELAGLKRSEQEEAKAFLSEQVDSFRSPYARENVTYPRRVVFLGTANGDDYLQDHTGNRRWLPIEVGKCNPKGLAAERDQLWAEAVVSYRNGEQWWVDVSAEVKAQQAARVEYDPLEDEILSFCEGKDVVCFQQIAMLVGEKPGDKRLAARVKRAMVRMGWIKGGRRSLVVPFPFGPGIPGATDRQIHSCFWEKP